MSLLLNLIIFHRRYGCMDEASTDAEQGEKILYFYPYDVPLYNQLNKMNLIEGLIDFSTKFSNEPITTVLMKDTTIAFFQCEDTDLWIVAIFDNSSSTTSSASSCSSSGSGTQSFYVNGTGIVDGLTKMYKLFTSLFGSITSIVTGSSSSSSSSSSSGASVETINRVQELRKKIRKLKQRLAQEYQDKERLLHIQKIHGGDPVDDDAFPIDVLTNIKTLSAIDQEISVIEAEIADIGMQMDQLLVSESYTLKKTRSVLVHFMCWYLPLGELLYPSALHGMVGLNYTPAGPHGFQALLRVRQCISELTNGCVVIHNGKVLWSDLSDDSTLCLFEYIKMNEFQYIRDSFSCLSHSSSNLTQGQQSSLDAEWFMNISSRRGFIGKDWNTIDLDDIVFVPPDAAAASTDATIDGTVRGTDASFVNAKIDSILSYHCYTPKNIWCPCIYTCTDHNMSVGNDGVNDIGLSINRSSSTECIGRAVVYRQTNHIVICLMPVWTDTTGPITAYKSHMNHQRDDILEYDNSDKLLSFCSSLQRALTNELENLSKALRAPVPASISTDSFYANGSSSSSSGSSSGSGSGSGGIDGMGKDSKKYTAGLSSLPDNTRLLYYNKCTLSIKTVNLCRFRQEPLSIWPTSIKLTKRDDDLNRSVLLADTRPKFPLSSSLLSYIIELPIIKAFNDVRETLSSKHNRGGDCVVTEACVRITSHKRGNSSWLVGRRFGERYMFLIVEGKNNLNDMYDQVTATTDGILSHILI